MLCSFRDITVSDDTGNSDGILGDLFRDIY